MTPGGRPAGNFEQLSLDIEDIEVDYGPGTPAALVDLSMRIPHGARVAVVGPNGSGKSTLFKTLVGLLPMRRGRIFIHGRPLGSHEDCVAYVPQREEVDLRFPVTVSDVVSMGRYGRRGWLKRLSAEDRRRAWFWLERLGLGALAGRPVAELSGGEQQRMFIARALTQEPHVLLMDEPFTGVDVATQEVIFELLDELREREVTVLVSTHDLRLASDRFELVALLNRRLVAFGEPREVLTPLTLAEAFAGQALRVNGTIVVDQCCGHEGPGPGAATWQEQRSGCARGAER